MAIKIVTRKNAYHDSVTLMSISGKLTAMEGVAEAVVSMATEMNKELLQNVGMYTDDMSELGPNDLVIAIKANDNDICEQAVALVEEMLNKRGAAMKNSNQPAPNTISSAVKQTPGSNLAIISVPGAYAAREAMEALKNGLHVMMFSDNVSLEDEIRLKQFAHEKGLLMMGPDCGTAIINNVGLCFANAVNKGNIGIVGASGTGTQEVTVLIDRYGGGVSQVIGTGGRDLTEAVGGIMMLDAFAALSRDEATDVIVLISKPPAKAIADKVLAAVKQCQKPVVVCFINGDRSEIEKAGAFYGGSLEETARKAVMLARGEQGEVSCDYQSIAPLAHSRKVKLSPKQKYVRGLYTGGTLCDEAMHIVQSQVGTVYSNIAKGAGKLADPTCSKEHTFIDLGDDIFTVGRPHPMIEPGLRTARLLQEAKDEEVAVILLDVVLGYGAHPDPAGVLVPAIAEAKRIAKDAGRYLEIIAYVLGTDKDPQVRSEQEQKLAAEGVTLAQSNARAAQLAAAIVGQGDR